YAMISGVSSIAHALMEPFDDRSSRLLDRQELHSLLLVFATQIAVQVVITFPLPQGAISAIFLVVVFLNVVHMLRILGYFTIEYCLHIEYEITLRDRRELEKSRMLHKERIQAMREHLVQEGRGPPYLGKLNPIRVHVRVWYNPVSTILCLVRRYKSLHSRLALVRVLEDGSDPRTAAPSAQLYAVLVPKAPCRTLPRLRYCFLGTPLPSHCEYRINSWERDYFQRTQRSLLDHFARQCGWNSIGGDIHEFILRVLLAYAQRERRERQENCGVLPEVTDERVSDAGGVHEVPWYKKCSVLKLPEDITTDELHDVPVVERDKHRAPLYLSKISKRARETIPNEMSFHGDELFRASLRAKKISSSSVTEIRRKWESEKMDNKREKLPSSSRGGPTRKREWPLRHEQRSAVSAVVNAQATN
ncbi:hypothetical protein FOZ62_027428, partial [Perkinsus olseni]